ncbi:MAG: PKD domain-containing protein [Chitinophagaceae bacterium]|nr:PKD domain-containing protein [Chitinophagaceae bacterium]
MQRLLFILILSLSVNQLNAATKRVLFIGNSYTYVNDLPNMVREVALSMGDTMIVSSVTPGGFTFNQHSVNAATLSAIQAGNWDLVILQEQSQIPAFSPAQVQNDCVPYAKKLCDSIKHYNACAEIVFYMTWGRKNGDASNCANYPPICTYAGMQQGLYDSYLMLSDSNNATCAPVGAVWRVLRNQYPTIELYSADESHPSLNGTYLAACTFYTSLFRKPVLNSQYLPAGVGNSDGYYMRQVSDAVVLDSLELWQVNGNLPRAQFTKTINGAQVNFSNTSLRAGQYSWNFGDGSTPVTTTSPSHTYATSGTYVVRLTATSTTCQTAEKTDTIQIQVASGLETINSGNKNIDVYTANQQFMGHAKHTGTLTVYNGMGQCIAHLNLMAGESFAMPLPAAGLYLWHWLNKQENTLCRGKVMAN